MAIVEILIIEDEKKVAELIKRGLEEYNYTVSVANDGKTGMDMALSKDYDLIITDIILPNVNGIELCRQIRTAKAHVPIIMLTALGTTDDKVEGFNAGADDYLVKPFDFRELYARIKVLMKRNFNEAHQSHVLKYADLEMNLKTKSVKREGKEIDLTPKEFKLMEYIMSNPERVLSRSEIADKVWETHFDTGTNFIDVYINYLRKSRQGFS
ncbi:MAG: response regulator transcription factor [Segetibacter sp.]